MTEHQQQPGNQPGPHYYSPPPQPGQTYPQPPTAPTKKKAPTWAVVTAAVILGVCGIGVVAAIAAGGTDLEEPGTAAAPADSDDAPAEPAADKPEPEVEETTEPEPAEPELTAAQEQAVGVAQDYLDYSGFSRKGLIEQLEYEGFSEEDATFGVDYLEVSWKEQAVKVAENYLEYSHFSRQGLIDQLEYEGFTAEQAEYGVTEAGL